MTLAACFTCGTSLSAARRRGVCSLSGRRPEGTGCPGERGGRAEGEAGPRRSLVPYAWLSLLPSPSPTAPPLSSMRRRSKLRLTSSSGAYTSSPSSTGRTWWWLIPRRWWRRSATCCPWSLRRATLSPYLNMQPSAPDRPNPDRILPARLVGHSSLPSSPLSPPCSSQPISAISTTASKEFSLRKALAKMQAEWGDKFFHCTPYKDTGTAVVGQTDDIQVWRCGTVGKYGVQTGEMPPLTQQGAYPPGPALSVCVLQDQTPTALNPIPPPPLPDVADRPTQDEACRECYKP